MVHVVDSPKKEFLAIITAYLPDSDEWGPGLAKRIENELCSLSRKDEEGARAISCGSQGVSFIT